MILFHTNESNSRASRASWCRAFAGPRREKKKAGAHRLPAFDFFMSKTCFNQECIQFHKKKKTDPLKTVFF